MLDHLQTLCQLNATSGREERVRAYILSCLENIFDFLNIYYIIY